MPLNLRPFPMAPAYLVSPDGRIMNAAGTDWLRPCAMKRGGYLAVSLWQNGKGKTWPVHVVVALTFHGPRPSPIHHAAHSDGNRQHNASGNISWKTKSENEADKVAHGTSNRGDRNGMAKLNSEQIEAIRRRERTRGYQVRIAAEFGITQSAVSRIISGERHAA